jgi:uncharacterized cupin superfamily protein
MLPTLNEPVIGQPISVTGNTLVVHEWRGSGPDYMHVHYEDDEAWHVLEGTLIFKFRDRTIEARQGTTVFVPQGVPHTYRTNGPTRYLMILTPRLNGLISELHSTPYDQHASVMQKYKSEIIN